MPWAIAVMFVALWLLFVLSDITLNGFIHILLVIAIIAGLLGVAAGLIRFIQERRLL